MFNKIHKHYANFHINTEKTYKFSKKTIEKYMKKYTKKLKYFITYNRKPKIQSKICKSSRISCQ